MNRPPFERVDKVAGYCCRADLHCPGCVIEEMIAVRDASPAAAAMPTEAALDQCADAMAIDRDDETSYDRGEFPKVLLCVDLADSDRCGRRHEPF